MMQNKVLDFIEKYLGEHFYGERSTFHDEISRLANDEARIAFAAPRGHAKSTLITLGYALYAAAHQIHQFVLILSATKELAEEHVETIQMELSDNAELIADFPHLELESDRAGALITKGGVSFLAKGAGQRLRGRKRGHIRPSLIIVDDLDDELQVDMERHVGKLKKWFLGNVSNLFGPSDGQIIVLGNIFDHQSFLAWLLSAEGSASYVKRVYRAEEGEFILWPAAWSTEKLAAKRREIGDERYAAEYLNAPMKDEDGAEDELRPLFDMEWIKPYRVAVAPRLRRVVVGVDPCITGTGDVCGIVVVGQGHNGHFYVLRDASIRGTPATWARAVIRMTRHYKAWAIAYEGNQGGLMVKQSILSMKGEGRLPRMEQIYSTKDKAARATPVAVLYENGEVSHVGVHLRLEQQQTSWIPGTKPSPDRLDALVLAMTLLTTSKRTVYAEVV